MISKAIIAALAIVVAAPAVAVAQQAWPSYSAVPPGYGEHERLRQEERANHIMERERIERERAAERERHRIRCTHNPYDPNCYR